MTKSKSITRHLIWFHAWDHKLQQQVDTPFKEVLALCDNEEEARAKGQKMADVMSLLLSEEADSVATRFSVVFFTKPIDE